MLARHDAVALEQQLRPARGARVDGSRAGAPNSGPSATSGPGLRSAPRRRRAEPASAQAALGLPAEARRRRLGHAAARTRRWSPRPAHTRSHSASLQLLGPRSDSTEQVGEEAGALPQPFRQRVVRRAFGGPPLSEAAQAQARPHGSTAPRGRCGARAHPRPTHTTSPLAQSGRATPASTRQRGAVARRAPTPRGERQPLQRHEHLAQTVDTGAGATDAVDALPARREARQRPLVDGLDLLRSTASDAGAAGATRSASHHSRCVPPGAARRGARARRARARPSAGLDVDAVRAQHHARLERAVRAREAAQQPSRASGTSHEERLRQATGGTAPSASRYSPASSAAIQRCSPPMRTRTARRSCASCCEPRARVGRVAHGAARASAAVRSPTRRSRSCSSSASPPACSERRCRSASTCSSAPGR